MSVSEDDRRQADGRGESGERKTPSRFRLDRRTVGAFLVVLVLNYIVVSLISSAAAKQRVEIPYQPTFLAQVREGNVSAISAKGTAIKGTFKEAVRYPPTCSRAALDFRRGRAARGHHAERFPAVLVASPLLNRCHECPRRIGVRLITNH